VGVTYNTAGIVTDGLVLALDAANTKSYPGSGTTWTDLSGNGNNGTLVNGVGYSGDNLGSLVFDGTDDVVELVNFPQIFSSSVAMCGWFYFSESNTRDILFGSYNNSIGINFEKHTSDRLRLYWHGNTVVDTFSSNNVVSSGAWTYIAIQRNKTAQLIQFYVNGNLVSQPSVSLFDISNSLTTFRVGRDIRTGTTALSGNISQVSIYNRALTESEIQQNFNSSRHRYGI
jgi:hypothetical protein